MAETRTNTAADGAGLSSADPGPEARSLFSTVVAHPVDFDADIAWPADPDAMMDAHHPQQTWPVSGHPRAAPMDEERRPSVCANVGGTDGMRALAVEHVAEFMVSFVGKPYAAIAALVHPMDRETVIGRALLARAPPTCAYSDDVESGYARARSPPGCRRHRLFLAYVSSHVVHTGHAYSWVMNARHVLCDFILIFEQGQLPRPCLRHQFDAVALLPPLDVPLHKLIGGDAEQSSVRALLAQGRSALFCADSLNVTPFDLPLHPGDATTPVQDQFHAHVAWRMHYALTRASSPQVRGAQAGLRTRDPVPTLAHACARACLGRLDAIGDANVPIECLHAIAEAAALWIDLADDSPANYAAMAALRRFVGRLARSCVVQDTAQWPTAAVVRHFLDSAARRASC